MSDEEGFVHHRIEQVGLALEVYRRWPLESIIEGDSGNIYQRIADTEGLVFLRYGPNETIDAFMKTLVGSITTVSVVSDQVIVFCKTKARHLTLLQERSAIGVYRRPAGQRLVHEDSPRTRTIISVFSFNHEATPVLVGYRIPEQSLDFYRAVLERTMGSIEAL